MRRIYKTALGKTLDFDKLRILNEKSVAVGNAKSNARGDKITPGGEIIKSKNQIMKEYYQASTAQIPKMHPRKKN